MIIVGTIAAGVVVLTSILLGGIWVVDAIRYAEHRCWEEEYHARSSRRARYYQIGKERK